MQWNPEQLNQQLRPFKIHEDNELNLLEKTYCQFYGLDVQTRDAVDHHLGYFDAIGFRIALHSYTQRQARGSVFIFHGYFDHAGLYTHLIRYLLNAGYNVVIYDLPGHGISSGEPASIENFMQYEAVLKHCLGLLRDDMPGPWFAVGQSTGGAILLQYMISHRHSHIAFEHCVLLAPLVRAASWTSVVWLHRMLGPFFKSWKRAFSANSHDDEFLDFLRNSDPMQAAAVSTRWVTALRRWERQVQKVTDLSFPVTIIQGQEDATVDWQYNIPFLRRTFSNYDLHFLPTGRHQLVNEAEEIRSQVFQWITDALQANAPNRC